MAPRFNTHQEARRAFEADRAHLASLGIHIDGAQAYISEDLRRNFEMAMDAIPALSTEANAGVPALLTTFIDPDIIEILFAPTKAAEIFGEVRKGNWLEQTAMFPVVESTGEVSSYGDFNNNGRAGVNTNWPQRQSYLFQTIEEYGDLELERAGLARVNWVGEIEKSAANVLNRFANLSYFFGVAGLQNYGLLNDPGLSAALTPALKAWGGTGWISGGEIKATANEVYADVQALFLQLVNQTGGLVDANTKMTLAMSPGSEVALTATNAFNVNVADLLKKNFPNLEVKTAVQYGAVSASNPQGVAGGNLVQLIAGEIEGQQTGYCAFNEKMRSFPIKRELSSYQKKVIGGSWGAIVRMPMAISQMIGV